MRISVILPTHAPHPGRLARTLAALRQQSLPPDEWELIVVDNASPRPLADADLGAPPPAPRRLVAEPALGLTAARRRGFLEARGELLVLVDDDNVLAPDYLARVAQHFGDEPDLGALGGRSLPEFEEPPAAWWQPEFDGLIACRDLGERPLRAADRVDPVTGVRDYPHCAPLGAGMALRRDALRAWLDDAGAGQLSDRRGAALSSGGDNDISLTLLRAGWKVAYFPDLRLTHLIPAGRVRADYLGRLNRGIARSWVQVLHRHHANPWPAVAPWTVPLRKLKAWFTYRPWRGPVASIRFQGACGHFEGLASLAR